MAGNKENNNNEKKETASRGFFLAHLKEIWAYVHSFCEWVWIGIMLGAIGGTVGAAFSHSIAFVTRFRASHGWVVYLLPLAGLVIVWLYGLEGMHPTDTNGVLLAVHKPESIPKSTQPLIFVSTVLTHLFGGSAGREGAALQLGGVMGHQLSLLYGKDEKSTHMYVLAGMSAVFSALFGTPITAAFFAMEVASVGILHFSGLIPCLTAALTASYLADLLETPTDVFPLTAVVEISVPTVGRVTVLAAAVAVMSIFYCIFLRRGGKLLQRLLPNPYVRVFVGGAAVVLLTLAVGRTDYNGGGIDVIERAIGEGIARPSDFAWKLLFTVVTMMAGYKGGEIVPAMFIGATLGCVLGPVLGLEAGIGAALGLLCMFCGSLNCPISSVFLGVELFGGEYILLFAVAAAVSYVLSANYGLYKEQKIVYSKLRPEFINRYTD